MQTRLSFVVPDKRSLVMALVGAAFGNWAASRVAVSVSNRQLKSFEKDLSDGRLLLVVDVPNERVKEVTRLVVSHLPQVDVRGAHRQQCTVLDAAQGGMPTGMRHIGAGLQRSPP
jgi:hypothetical protein